MPGKTMQKKNSTFCPGCGETVNTYSAKREGVVEVRCSFCGLTLESAVLERNLAERENIIIADDSELIQEMLRDALIENKIAKKVATCSDGFEFVAKITERFEQRLPIDLVILDIQMPIMSGINAAVAMRAIEHGFNRERRSVPILFFSVRRCDENLKKVLKYCKPARYVNKGISNSKEEMFDRIKKVITQLLE